MTTRGARKAKTRATCRAVGYIRRSTDRQEQSIPDRPVRRPAPVRSPKLHSVELVASPRIVRFERRLPPVLTAPQSIEG